MLDDWRRVEAVPHEPAPRLEVLRPAEVNGVVLHGVPGDDEAILQRLFDAALQG